MLRPEVLLAIPYKQACKLKFRLRELTSCLCSSPASAVCLNAALLVWMQPKLKMSCLNLQLSFQACIYDSQPDGYRRFRLKSRKPRSALASECDVGLAAAQLVGGVAGVVGKVLALHPPDDQSVATAPALHVPGINEYVLWIL